MKYMVPASLLIVALFAFTFGLTGCSSNSTEPGGSSAPAATDDEHGDHDHGDHEHGDHAHNDDGSRKTNMEKMEAELATLSPEDAASVLKQHMCPVSGEMLGAMGAPEKVAVNGQQVWICCDGCKEKLLANPDEYLAKLEKE